MRTTLSDRARAAGAAAKNATIRLIKELTTTRDDQIIATSISRVIDVADRPAYERWLNSSAVSTSHGDEMVIAFNLATLLRKPPGAVIRSLRGQRGQDRTLVRRLERIVAENESVRFVQDGRVRRVGFTDTRRLKPL